MTRAKHLQWCKDRALAYVETGELHCAFKQMVLDMHKHPETDCPDIMKMGVQLMAGGHLSTIPKMRKWIQGFG